LAELVAAGLIAKVGSTGKGVYYILAKGASKGQKGQLYVVGHSGFEMEYELDI